jgi:hypothetical protein
MQFFDRLRSHPAYWYVIAGLWIPVFILLAFQVGHLEKNYTYGSPGTSDFIEYWTAGKLLRHGENPYDWPKLRELQIDEGLPPDELPYDLPIIMWNPPWLLVWLYPLLLLPFLTAAQVWILVNSILILLASSLIWRTVDSGSQRPLGIAWVAAALFVPSLLTLRMGQMSSVILLGVAGFLYFASRNRDFLAGMFLTLTTVKPHVVYLVLIAVFCWVVLERRWKIVAGGLATLLPTLAVLTLLWPGWLPAYRAATAQPPLYWKTASLGGILRHLVFNEEDEIPPDDKGQAGEAKNPGDSNNRMTDRERTLHQFAQFVPPILGCIGAIAFWFLRRPQFDWKAIMGPLLLVSVPTAAYGWAYDQVLLMVPYLTIVYWLLDKASLTPIQKALAVAGLIAIAAGMVTENLYGIPEVFFFWPPLVLAAIYLYLWHSRQPKCQVQAA